MSPVWPRVAGMTPEERNAMARADLRRRLSVQERAPASAIQRAYVSGSLAASGATTYATGVIISATLEIPDANARVMAWYDLSGITMSNNTTTFVIGFREPTDMVNGLDLANLVNFTTGPTASLQPPIAQNIAGFVINNPNGHLSMPFMPYSSLANSTPTPTVGTRTYQLCCKRTVGTGTLAIGANGAKLWVAVV